MGKFLHSFGMGNRWIYVPVGCISFASAALALLFFPSTLAGIEFHPIHVDSIYYLCRGIQLGPLEAHQAQSLLLNLAQRYGQVPNLCFESDGSEALVLRTYYPRVTVALLVAGASALSSAWAVLAIPVVVMAGIGALWGWMVAAPASRSTWLRIVVLLAPVVSFPWVLWLGSLMTEGIFALFLLSTVALFWLWEHGRISRPGYAGGLFAAGGLLLLTRTAWPISGVLWGLAIEALIPRNESIQRGRAPSRVMSGTVFVLSQALGTLGALVLSRGLDRLVTPRAKFPPSNEPPTVIPVNPEEILFVLRVSFDSLVVGVQQSLALMDLVSIALIFFMPLLLVLILFKAPWRTTYFVLGNWFVAMSVVGVVSVCCGGVNSYFRYQIPTMFLTLAVAWLAGSHVPMPADRSGPVARAPGLTGEQ